MIKLQHLIGLPVIVVHTGKQVGQAKDAWFDEHWLVKGIIIDYGSKWFSRTMKVIHWEDVISCGEDAVIISSLDAVQRVQASDVGRTFQSGVIKLKDIPMMTIQGNQLGRISDVYFYPLQGTQIVGYELTDGFISDLMEGRKWLRAPEDAEAVMLGEDAIIVPSVSEAELEPVAASNSMNREK